MTIRKGLKKEREKEKEKEKAFPRFAERRKGVREREDDKTQNYTMWSLRSLTNTMLQNEKVDSPHSL